MSCSESLSLLHAVEVEMKGSYAGARAAHMRVLYPDLVFGAIASSGAFNILLLTLRRTDQYSHILL